MLKKLLSLFKPKYKSISPRDAKAAIESGTYFVLDVRSSGEFSSGKIKGAKNIPLNELFTRFVELEKYMNKPVLVNCLSGGRSASACSVLVSKGFSDVTNLSGGMMAWRGAGLKVN